MIYNLKDHIIPYSYQVKGVQGAFDRRYFIIGDEMGLGKSLQGIMLDQVLRNKSIVKKTLIICPAFLRTNWLHEYNNICKKAPGIKILKTRKEVQASKFESEVVIIGYGSVEHSAHLFEAADYIIWDEIHYLKNIDAKRTQAAHEMVLNYKPKFMLGLSGTPITKGVDDWYSLLMLMGHNPMGTSGITLEGVSIWQFKAKFMIPKKQWVRYKDKRTGQMVGKDITVYEGLKNLDGLKRLLKGKYVRRLAKDHLELPPLIYKKVTVSHKSNPKLEAEWQDSLNTSKDATAKKESAISKIKFSVEYCKNLFEETGTPVVIFSDHREPAIEIAKALGVKPITGTTPMAQREAITEEFKAGKSDFIVVTIGAGKEGHTWTISQDVVFNDFPWTPAFLAQAKKRVHRISQKKTTRVHYIVGSPQDEHIMDRLNTTAKTLLEAL